MMDFKFVLASLVVVLIALPYYNAVGQISKGPSSAKEGGRLGMIGGHNTTIQKHPYLVSVTFDTYKGCSGTIINRRWIITAGVCVYYEGTPDLQWYKVIAGSSDGVSGTVYDVMSIVVHPKYSRFTMYDYNYGLVQTNISMKWSTSIRPVKLPRRVPRVHTKLVVCGYGGGFFNSVTDLSQAIMYWQSKKTCVRYFQPPDVWTPRMACAYNKGTSLCYNDGGDPFVKNGVLYAMFSNIFNQFDCTDDSNPQILSNIFPVVSWIKNVTTANNEEKQT